jgi:hypothetical protein
MWTLMTLGPLVGYDTACSTPMAFKACHAAIAGSGWPLTCCSTMRAGMMLGLRLLILACSATRRCLAADARSFLKTYRKSSPRDLAIFVELRLMRDTAASLDA